MSIPAIADQLAALRAKDAKVDHRLSWESQMGVKHVFACDSCRTERKWGWTNVQTPDEEVMRPLLTCEACGGHTPHTFKRYQ